MNNKNNWIKKAKTKYSNKYDYSKVNYINSKISVIINCKQHGEFNQTPSNHLRSEGCNVCSKKSTLIKQTANFIKKSNKIHNNQYLYDKPYSSNMGPIVITCKQHGKFTQIAQNHLAGYGCPKCGKLKIRQYTKIALLKNSKGFLSRAIKIHNNKYGYSKSIYKSTHEKIIITCKTHGEFNQTPSSHLAGHGCKKCANDKNKLNAKSFLNRAIKIHGDKYDYSKSVYIKTDSIVIIICKKHGKFSQRASSHLAGHGCKKCAIDNITDNTKMFIAKAIETHGDKYDYSQTNYFHSSAKINIICPSHGKFNQIANNHINGNGCPKCWQKISKQQEELHNFIVSHNIIAYQNNRNIISPLEIDILIPNLLGIEYHGVYHHSANTTKKDEFLKFRIQQKAKIAIKRKLKLLQIFSYEWQQKKEIWKSIILHHLKLLNTIDSIKLKSIILSQKQNENFFNQNHLCGNITSDICYALTDGNILLSAMSFIQYKQNWKIQQFADIINRSIINGKRKLFNNFLLNVKPQCVIIQINLRYPDHNDYENLGFVINNITDPNYNYINNNGEIQNKLKFKSEDMFNNGFRRLWDAGNIELTYK